MAKFMIRASYATEGAKGILKDGGSGRARAADELIRSMGGKMEAFYFAFGDDDAYVLIDAPDNVSVAAASLAVCASGAVVTKTTVLMTPEEMDEATKKTVSYRPPGQ
jgi:uncharacterized protein with GYD domain